MKFSLKKKLTLSIVLVIVIFGSLATYSVFLYSRKTFVENAKDTLLLATIEQANETRQVLIHSEELVETIARRGEVISYLENNPQTQDEEILSRLHSYNIGESYSSIYLLDLEGKTLTSTDPSFAGKNYSFRDYFKKAVAGSPVVDIALGVTSKKLGYYFSYPVRSADDEVIGVVVAKLTPEKVNETIEIANVTDEAHVMLVDCCGVVVFSDKPDRIYKSLGPLTVEQRERLESKKRYPDIKIENIQYDVVQEGLEGIEESEMFDVYDELDGERELLAVAKIGGYPFYVIVEEEAEAYTKQALSVAALLSIFVMVAALVAVVIIYFVQARFLKPLTELREVAEEVSAGNLDRRADIRTGDEIEDLAKSFNHMTSTLQENIKSVEAQVDKRTKDLERLNEKMVGRELKMIELKKEMEKLEEKEEGDNENE